MGPSVLQPANSAAGHCPLAICTDKLFPPTETRNENFRVASSPPLITAVADNDSSSLNHAPLPVEMHLFRHAKVPQGAEIIRFPELIDDT